MIRELSETSCFVATREGCEICHVVVIATRDKQLNRYQVV